LSVKTVSTYRARILEKMHMQNNAELIHYAFQNGSGGLMKHPDNSSPTPLA
jgi:DNA-binding NarL/FixJ family response regulator